MRERGGSVRKSPRFVVGRLNGRFSWVVYVAQLVVE